MNEKIMIAQNGGKDIVSGFLLLNQTLNLSQYKQACIDMDDANNKGTYFRDIKNENFVVKNKSSMVKFINIEDAVTKKYKKYYAKDCGIKELCSRGLLKGKINGQSELLKASDQYAMLLLIMEGTDDNCGDAILRNNGIKNYGIIHRSNGNKTLKDEKLIKEWIDAYVIEEYQKRNQQLPYKSI